MVSTARDQLRTATAEAHRRIDEHPWILDLLEGRLDRERYAALLRSYHRWFRPFEGHMKNACPELTEALGGFRFEKSAWLEEDLRQLGVGTDAPGNPSLPASAAGLAGLLYVVEGSTLGGAHLTRRVRFPGEAGRFYRGYGDRTGTAWKEFLDWLEPALESDAAREEAAAAARAAFSDFQEVIDAAARTR